MNVHYCRSHIVFMGQVIIMKWPTLQEENCHWNLNFAILSTANSLAFNSADFRIFKNLSTMAYITKNQNSLIINSVNLAILGA